MRSGGGGGAPGVRRNPVIDSAIAKARARADSAGDRTDYVGLWYMYMQELGKMGKLIPVRVSHKSF